MVAHRVDLGSVADPVIAGNPLRLNVVARTNSGQAAGSYGVINLSDVGAIRYALFDLDGDLPVTSPSFVLGLAEGISITNAAAGEFSILVGSHTALWTGRDWHACRIVDIAGLPFDLFDGLVVSTRALTY